MITEVKIYDTPADIDVGTANYPGPHDGADVVVMDWDGETIIATKDAAVDVAYGILHLASEPAPTVKESFLDPIAMFSGFCWATLLTVWVWICWNSMSYWIG